MKTIFNTYIKVESQEQADRLKQICIDNDLPIWDDIDAFKISNYVPKYFYFNFSCKEFWISYTLNEGLDKVTESEWLELLKEYKK